jgi:hypothetical protein
VSISLISVNFIIVFKIQMLLHFGIVSKISKSYLTILVERISSQ